MAKVAQEPEVSLCSETTALRAIWNLLLGAKFQKYARQGQYFTSITQCVIFNFNISFLTCVHHRRYLYNF